MMKKNLFTIFFCFAINTIFTQQLNVSELGINENHDKSVLYKFISHATGVYSILFSDNNKLTVEFIGSNLQSANRFTTQLPENANILSVLLYQDKPAIVFSLYHIDKKTHACYFSLIEELSNTNQYFLLSEIKNCVATNSGKFSFVISEDESHFAVIKEFPFEKNKNEQLNVSVFERSELKKIWSKDYVLDVLSRINPINVYLINNKGEVYAVKKEQDKTNYKFILYCFNKESSLTNSRTFTLQGKYISDIIPAISKKGEFILAGFYSTLNYTDYEGYFIYRFNHSMQPVFRQVNTFGSAILTNVLGKKAGAKEGACLSGFMLEYIAQRKDGGFYFLAEKHRVYKDKSGSDMLLDEEIFVFSTDADGNALGANLIKKKQETPKHNEKYTSFNYWLHKDSLNIIYNKINFDETLLKQEKKIKADEFGANNFAGTTWLCINNKCEIKKTKLLTGLFKDSPAPMAIHVNKLAINNQENIWLFSSDYLNKYYKYIYLEFKEKD